MRILAAFLLTIAAGEAQASSIVELESIQQNIGPSIIVLGALEGVTVEVPGGPSITTVAAEGSRNSPSVISLGSASQAGPSIIFLDLPGKDEAVAASPGSTDADAPGMGPIPMVIRGGLVGEAFVRQGPAGASQADDTAQLPALDPNDRGTPAKRKALKRRQQQLEQEQASAPADAPEAAVPLGE